MTNDTPLDEGDEIPSKTFQKQVMHDLQDLGLKLLGLSTKQLAQMPIDDILRNAIKETGRIKSHSALKRHKQFIGKLMRDVDPGPIIEQFEIIESPHQMLNKTFHHLEDLRDQLITGDKNVIGGVINEYPDIDKQKLRQLVKNAKKEKEYNRTHETDTSNKQGRALFRLLREQALEIAEAKKNVTVPTIGSIDKEQD